MENKEVEEKKENCGTTVMPDELINFKKICSSRCTICSSGILKEIHDWRKNGAHYARICERAKDEFGVSVSEASLCRHFKGFITYKTNLATQIIKNDVLEEVTSQAVHMKRTVELLDLAYDQLLLKFKSNTYKIEVSDLEKLAKMRYQIMNGEQLDENNIKAIFQRATNEYGLDIQQGVLL